MRGLFGAVALAAMGAACGPPLGGEVGDLAVPFHVIAHRGASAEAPENTLPAFERALELGASEVELDVQLSRDDVLIVFHDGRLERKTNLSGRVRDYSAAELGKAEIGSWFDDSHPKAPRSFAGTHLVTLAEVFDALGEKLHYHVEIKADQESIPRLLLREIRNFGLEKHVTITSFLQSQLERTRSLDSDVPICLLVGDRRRLRDAAGDGAILRDLRLRSLQEQRVDAALRLGFDQLGLPAEDLSREIVAYAQQRGLEVRAWRIKRDADVERALAAGANGMTTNWPDRLLARIGR